MNLSDLKSEIRTNSIKDFYIFVGKEFGIRNIYIKKIAEKLNMSISYVDSLLEIWDNLNVENLFGRGTVYVVYEDVDALNVKSMNDLLLSSQYIKSGVVILVYSELPKKVSRGLFVDRMVGFSELSDDILKIFCSEKLKGAEMYYSELIKRCGNSYTRLMFMIDKIKSLMESRNVSAVELIRELLNDRNWFEVDTQDVIFSLIDSILSVEPNKTFELLKIADENHPLIVLTLLYQKLIQILKYCGVDDKSMEKTGLNYYQFKDCSRYVREVGWNVSFVLSCLDKMQLMERLIKQGKINPFLAVEYLILYIIQ